MTGMIEESLISCLSLAGLERRKIKINCHLHRTKISYFEMFFLFDEKELTEFFHWFCIGNIDHRYKHQ